MINNKQSQGVTIIGLTVFIANAAALALHLYFPAVFKISLFPKALPLLAMLAVFPLKFYSSYLGGHWPAHLGWVMVMMVAALGVLLYNRLARMVFIVLNIINVTLLASVMLLPSGTNAFSLDNFFRLYFNLVITGAYVGFLTLPEVRNQFHPGFEQNVLANWRKRLEEPVVRDAGSYYNLGLAYCRLERYTDAVANLKKAIALEPDRAAGYAALGEVYLKRRDYAAAAGYLKEAVARDPVYPGAYYQLGRAYEAQGCSAEAVEAFVKATHVDPSAKVYRALGAACVSAGRVAEALEYLKRAVDLDPMDAAAHYGLGRLYQEHLENLDGARKALQKAAQLDPGNTDAWFRLGLVNNKLERPKDALRAFKEAVGRDDGNKEAHYQLGFTYALLGDHDSARREYKCLLDADPDMAEALKLMLG